ncbi:citrate lyase subunit alpha [Secundilactobacillus kimchicus]|uniref:Citrate lyase alpha chain n=1 Tax=Secundilactobacillus kimchicus JCM 15530 TaxID=1302272 RepID=A0A0R1HWI3_9LACO|nr:citrate lyase subunit alpha [Secundilactobacillus kimchicus]KRK47722.1 citF protein [Secundilactobacillus kimchicus JCM 15530]
MINSVGRDIPDEYLKNGVEPFQGIYYRDGYTYPKAAPKVSAYVKPTGDKMIASIRGAIIASGLKDGMTISFHHHLRDGDYVVNMVMKEIHQLGIKDLTVCASSLGKAHSYLVPCIEDGTVTGISTSGIRDEIGEVVSEGKLKNPAVIRSHGGRARAIEDGTVKIDVAFIGASTSDAFGNASGKGGQSDTGVLAYADGDAKYANKVVVITDTIVDVPNFPASIKGVDVDYVVKVDSIGDPTKIATGALRLTTDTRELDMAKEVAKCMYYSGYFKDGFSFQTGAGGPSLATTTFLKQYMEQDHITCGWAMGGVTEPIVNLFNEGYIKTVLDDQSFDLAAVASANEGRHFEISASQYANPFNKGAFVNQLNFVILGALEIDTDFNVNVVQGSNGVLRGAPGGHPDTAAGADVSIIVAPLIRSRMPTVRDQVTSVTTPGESIDVVVTDYGVAVNPKRQDLLKAFRQTNIALKSIEELRDLAYQYTGKPAPVEFDDQVVALVEYRDGTIIDTIRKPKSLN